MGAGSAAGFPGAVAMYGMGLTQPREFNGDGFIGENVTTTHRRE